MFSWDAACTRRAAMSLAIINIECSPAIKLSQVKLPMVELLTCQTSPICLVIPRLSKLCECLLKLFITSPALQYHTRTSRHGEVDTVLHMYINMEELGEQGNEPEPRGLSTHSCIKLLNHSKLGEMLQFSSSSSS